VVGPRGPQGFLRAGPCVHQTHESIHESRKVGRREDLLENSSRGPRIMLSELIPRIILAIVIEFCLGITVSKSTTGLEIRLVLIPVM
jgi:hypothetical protein